MNTIAIETETRPVAEWLPKGDSDEIVPFHHSKHAAEKIPNATLTVFEGVGHLIASRFSEVAAALIG